MYTGLIHSVGHILQSTPTKAGRRLVVSAPPALLTNPPPTPGPANTTLGDLQPAARVHLERSCTPTTLLGGHLVQGHVDAVATVAAVTEHPQWRIRIAPPPHLMPYITPRGSICVAGVSLTIAELSVPENWFEVALIPDTLARTTLGALTPGDGVNLECDAMVKALIHWQQHYADQKTPQQPKATP
jgi:riboflavin synthase alpha subunit